MQITKAEQAMRAAGVTVAEPVTVGGWYPTTDGRWAEVEWYAGQQRVLRVEDRVPTRAEEDARMVREEAEQFAARSRR